MSGGGSEIRKAKRIASSPPPHISNEIIFSQILPRLAAEPLLRFSSVSKVWCATIADPKFVALHFMRSKTNPLLFGIFENKQQLSTKHLVLNLDVGEQLGGYIDVQKFSKTKIGGPARVLVGNCNGLLCFLSYISLIRLGLEILNPSTREILVIPLPNVDNDLLGGRNPHYGFGFDFLTNEYKVVCWCLVAKCLMVYTLGTKSWRSVGLGVPIDMFDPSIDPKPVFIDGALYWQANDIYGVDDDSTKFISFDIHSEQLLVIPGPRGLGFCQYMFERQGCVCLISNSGAHWNNSGGHWKFFDLSILNKDTNNKHFWARETILLPSEAEVAMKGSNPIGAVGFLNQILLHSMDDQDFLTLSDLYTGTKKLVKMLPNFGGHFYEILYYVENLLSLETFVPPGESEVVCVSPSNNVAPHFIEEVLLHTGSYGYQ